MDSGDKILMAAGVTAAVMVGAFVLWGPSGMQERMDVRRWIDSNFPPSLLQDLLAFASDADK